MRRVCLSKRTQVGTVPQLALRFNNNNNNSSSSNNHSNSGNTVGVELPDPPYALPTSSRFDAERGGMFDKNWLLQLPKQKPLLRNSVYLPSKEELWRTPAYQGLEIIAESLPYHDVLRYIMEHNFFFLFKTLLKSRDAPLPHVMYEDFMKCRTFSSLQNPPEEQFALSPTLLRSLLCMAAHQCILDPHYFTTCQMLFRRIEQQQSVSSEVLSAWVYCCAASGKVDDALTYAKYMADHDIPFDETVFSLMQHPSIDPVAAEHNAVSHAAKGLLLQRRLSGRLHTVYRSDSVAAHGMFVFYALTLSHAKKWEVIRAAASLGVGLTERTLSLAVEVYAREKGLRCGPKTVKAFSLFLARDGTVGNLLYVLLRTRKNELLPDFQGLAKTAFSVEEQKEILHCVEYRARRDEGFAAARSLLSTLVGEDEPHELFRALSHTVRANNSSGTADVGESDESSNMNAVVTSVQSILRDVDTLDKASSKASTTPTTSVAAGRGVEKTGEYRFTVKDENVLQEELEKLYDCNLPTSMRELAQMHILEEAELAERVKRLSEAWVNPDSL
ncbi:uncharacterized protein TM35_000192790 [Trypanosoma theileri]|uniref:Uncharacterized protein n=1 Tax=Trypanosoma theileri TaxID=67003 RepID=A0A1X0NTL4_9TRYP|nr:uncharacterized protein TM35_000192790 [Trypanosoma theileri]ORC88035.1 hypothetical protein TM35_000192790 [Trypanosoma theileri]